LDVSVAPGQTPTPTASDLELTAAAFEFVDPPEPGAAARLTLSIHNPTDHSSGPISVSVPLSWLSGYRIQATDPALIDGTQTATGLRLGFGAAEPLSNADFSIDVVAIDEVIDSPAVTLFDGEGRLIGQAHPPTQAPPSRPGPIYSIDIPRLKLHTGVVPVEWEPPLFVVGQVRTSAFVSLGNSVLVGHVRGAPGYNVFDRLEQLAPGDQVVAHSRGQTYSFVVSETEVLPQDDTSPTMPTASARLTLMTCTGDWDPLTQNYPDRLWVIAEPDGPTEATQSRPPELRRLGAVQ
jgi:LPXTG-site transpeptidase (sortase) family protein